MRSPRRHASSSSTAAQDSLSSMRRVLALAILALALGLVAPAYGDEPKLEVMIDKKKVDIPNHKLEVKLSREASKVVIKVFGDSGTKLAEVEKKLESTPAGTAIEMTWTPSSEETV